MLTRLSEYTGSRYGALLVTLLTLMAVDPFVADYPLARWLVDLVSVALVLSMARAVGGGGRARLLVLALGIPAVVAAVAYKLGVESLYPAGLALRVSFFAVVVVRVFSDVLQRRRVTMDAVMAACCVYLMLGFAWGSIYSLLEWANPGSFRFPETETAALAASADRPAFEPPLRYFSLITMTTVGYGDIAPVSAPARTMAALQGLLAQLYVAIIIARMVSMELAQRGRDDPS